MLSPGSIFSHFRVSVALFLVARFNNCRMQLCNFMSLSLFYCAPQRAMCHMSDNGFKFFIIISVEVKGLILLFL